MNNSNKKELTEEEIETLLLLNYLEDEGMSTISNYANRFIHGIGYILSLVCLR